MEDKEKKGGIKERESQQPPVLLDILSVSSVEQGQMVQDGVCWHGSVIHLHHSYLKSAASDQRLEPCISSSEGKGFMKWELSLLFHS